jgi:hypothetical protein
MITKQIKQSSMKKIFTFLIAFFSITSLFAQSRNWNSNTNDRHQSTNTSSYGQSTYDNHNSYDNHNYGQPAYNNHNNDKRGDNDRNSGYEHRYDNYGHHSVNTYDVRRSAPVYNHRDDRYYGRETQRSGSTLKAVGAGLIVGGIIALIAGSH